MTKAVRGVIAACLWAAPLHADSIPSVLSWQECVTLAGKFNPALKASLLSMEASRADYKGSYNGILPQLSLSNSYNESGRSGVTSDGTWTAQGNASLNLINFGEWAQIQSASASYKQSRASVRVTSSQTLLDLYRAFSGLLYAQERINVNSLILNTWKINAQMVNLRYQSGRESKGNNMNTQAQYLQAKAALEQAQRDLRVAQQTLSDAMGTDGYADIRAEGTWDVPAVPYPRPNWAPLLALDPRIQAQEAVVEQARAGIKSAHSSLWPTLAMNYTRGATGQTEFPQNSFWTFTGTMNLPIFSGGPTAVYYASLSAERSFEKASQDLRAVRKQVRTNLETAWAKLAEAEAQVQVQGAFLDAARQRKDESDIRYKSGLMTFDEWNRVVSDFVNFQTSFLRTQQDRLQAEANWRFARGEPLL